MRRFFEVLVPEPDPARNGLADAARGTPSNIATSMSACLAPSTETREKPAPRQSSASSTGHRVTLGLDSDRITEGLVLFLGQDLTREVGISVGDGGDRIFLGKASAGHGLSSLPDPFQGCCSGETARSCTRTRRKGRVTRSIAAIRAEKQIQPNRCQQPKRPGQSPPVAAAALSRHRRAHLPSPPR